MQAYLPYLAACAGIALLWKLFRSTALSQKELKRRLTDRVVIVTGAARGLGRAVANEFGKAGAKVVLIDVLEPVLRATEKDLKTSYGENKVHAIVGDLSKKEVCQQAIDEVISKFGKLDVLYINHGIMPSNPVEKMAIETFEKVMSINFMSFVYLVKCAIPHLRASKGSYGVTSSMGGKIALINLAPYCSSKHALNGFMDVLRLEEREHGVSVTVVCPGGMKTELAVGDTIDKADDSKSYIKLHLPEDLAPGIVNAVAARKRDHYTEAILKTMGSVRALFPQFIDNIIGPLSKGTAGRS